MYFFNYNGGPEIVVSKSDDIYNSLISISPKEFNTYSLVKENLAHNLSTSNFDVIIEPEKVDPKYFLLSTTEDVNCHPKNSEKIKLRSNSKIIHLNK